MAGLRGSEIAPPGFQNYLSRFLRRNPEAQYSTTCPLETHLARGWEWSGFAILRLPPRGQKPGFAIACLPCGGFAKLPEGVHRASFLGFAILKLRPGVQNQASQLRVCLAGVLQGLPGTWVCICDLHTLLEHLRIGS